VDRTGTDRRALLAAVMIVLVGLIGLGGWFVDRTIARELALAELKADFVSAVSHEFRTPLTTVCQLSELLTRGRVASEDDRQQYYQLLHSESQRLKRLVETLLSFGRLESGRMPFHFEPIDVAALVQQVAEDFTRSDQASGHRLEVSVEGAAAAPADREMLRTVLWNLFENAAKYSPGKPLIRIDVRVERSDIVVSVRDEGVGIPPSEQHDIFEKFVRGKAARASGIRGTGLGLAVARQIVRSHGGEMALESRPGEGSTFTIALPALQLSGETPSHPTRPIQQNLESEIWNRSEI
jgi:signal transduction histidine kinase